MFKSVMTTFICLALLAGAKQPALAQGGRPVGPAQGSIQNGVYIWPQAGITLTLPASWVRYGYKWYEYWGDGSDPRRPAAEYVVEWVMVPSNPAYHEQALLTIAVYPTDAWNQIVAQGGPPPGTVIGRNASYVYVISTPQSNPYPEGTVDAARFDQLYTS